MVLAARVLAEFGDDPNRLCQRQGPQGLCRHRADHPRLRAAAGGVGQGGRESAAEHRLPSVGVCGLDRLGGCSRCYDVHRARGASHHQALRALANRLVGILHGCLRHRRPYDEQLAWPTATAAAAA
jgi:hypothetical protein